MTQNVSSAYTQELPPPECKLGYTSRQLDQILGMRRKHFDWWMRGQTMGLCDGNAAPEWRCTEPHGPAVYGHDLKNFLVGGPILD